MTTHTTKRDENERGALTRRLVERSGLSPHEAQDAVDAYMHAESLTAEDTAIMDTVPIAHRGN